MTAPHVNGDSANGSDETRTTYRYPQRMVKRSELGSQVFVIRMWLEPTADGRGARRGYVESVASGDRCYFSELADAFEFVAALGAIRPGPNSAAAGDANRP